MADWKLSRERLDQIIFAMENQETIFFLDMESGNIISEEEIENSGIDSKFHELPQWRSLEGFQLMERFVSSLRNPIFREEVREALSEGRGVFRSFKNILKKRREWEVLWFSFKEREMTRIVMDWLNEIRELEGLEKLSLPEEDTEELIYSDFVITESIENHIDAIREHDQWVFIEAFPGVEKDRILEYHRQIRSELPDLYDRESTVIIAETPGGDFAGFVWGYEKESPIETGTILELIQLVVAEEYQGLGLAQILLKHLLQKTCSVGTAKVQIHLYGRFLNAAKLFQKAGFQISAQTMELDLSRWEGDEDYSD